MASEASDKSEEDEQGIAGLVEKFRKNFINVADDEGSAYGQDCLNKIEFQIRINRTLQIMDKMFKNITLTLVFDTLLTTGASETFLKYFPGLGIDFFKTTDSGSVRTTHYILKALNKSQLKDEYALHIEQIPDSHKEILVHLGDLRGSTLSKLQMTARKEMNKEKILHKMFKRNELLEGKIMGLQYKLIDQQEMCKEKLLQKQSVVKKLINEIQSAKLNSERDVAECLRQSDEEMKNFCAANEGGQQNLVAEAQRANDLFLNTRDKNCRQEKVLRDKQKQVTHNLQAWLFKYDMDMKEKTEQLEELTCTLNRAVTKFTDWKTNRFDKQELEYKRLMLEKREEEKRAQHELMMIFMMNRAARIIQKHWRETMAKKKKSKGKGKGKGKGKK